MISYSYNAKIMILRYDPVTATHALLFERPGRIQTTTEGPKIRDEEVPKVLAPPPTAYIPEPIFSLGVAVDSLDEYKWHHLGGFWKFHLEPPKLTTF